jgi:hypothetical protein
MQRRIRQRLDAVGTTHVAFAPVLMSWTWNPASGRNPADWWVDGVWDLYGVDHYTDAEATLLNATWRSVRTWVGERGLDVAVGEWGTRGTDAAAGRRVRAWYDAAAGSSGDGGGARVVALSAFDSNLNSPNGGWELRGDQLTAFQALLADSRTAPAG